MKKTLLILFLVSISCFSQRQRALNYQSNTIGDASINAYDFNPTVAGIVEGVVSDAVALDNKNILNTELYNASQAGYTHFNIPAMDAYFDIEGETSGNNPLEAVTKNRGTIFLNSSEFVDLTPVTDWASIMMQPNLTVVMSDDTYIRNQPNALEYSSALICFYLINNAHIIGGNLVGDKYVANKELSEFNFGISTVGAHNCTISNVDSSQFMGDGLLIRNKYIRNADGSLTGTNKTTENLTVSGCVFDDNSRQGTSVIDSDGVILDNCTFSNTGQNLGMNPKSGVDIEATRDVDPVTGEILYYQIAENVIIRNCDFVNNFLSDIIIWVGDNVTIENNTFDGNILSLYGSNINIGYNTFTNSGGSFNQTAIQASSSRGSVEGTPNYGFDFSHSWNIYNNTISGYVIGIDIENRDGTVSNNIITDFNRVGIAISNGANNIAFNSNTTTSTQKNDTYQTRGIGSLLWEALDISGITIDNHIGTAYYGGLCLIGAEHEGGNLIISNSTFNGGEVSGNVDVKIVNSSNIELDNCTYTTTSLSGNTNVTIP